jgi:spermidine synthase
VLELRRRGERDFLVTRDGRVLMTSAAHRSEAALGELACAPVARRRAPRVLLGGLGMGFTLRAALEVLPPSARVVVVELHRVVIDWCRGPLGALTAGAACDPRVSFEVADVARVIAHAAVPFDAIALDLFEGPRGPRRDDPHFGQDALAGARAALAPGGVFAVWSERSEPAFEKRLKTAGFAVKRRRPGRGGLRHVVYIGLREPDTRDRQRRGAARHRR